MKRRLEIKPLLHYFWESPGIGVRFRYKNKVYAHVFKITNRLAELICPLFERKGE